MPCKDITDQLRLRLGNSNRVERYELTKVTCGGKVGKQRMIQPWLDDLTAEQVLSATPQEFLRFFAVEDELEEYLLLKQFFSVRAGVAILLGQEAGGPEDFCTVEAINHSERGTVLRAHIRIDTITDEIKACGNCGS
ncbi:MAG: hypothetical protein P1R58_00385 [bacterium]|nr:hypothetical protein [bacterium]